MVSTQSHFRTEPQAVQPSRHLASLLLKPGARFLEGVPLGQPWVPHWPLQTVLGAAQTHVVGLFAGLGVNPLRQSKPHGLPFMQAGMELSG